MYLLSILDHSDKSVHSLLLQATLAVFIIYAQGESVSGVHSTGGHGLKFLSAAQA